MSTDPRVRAEAFLNRFFGPGNGLAHRDSAGRDKPKFRKWVDRVRHNADRILLPRASGPDNTITWYALACSARDARAFREELLAAVGPSYSDFTGVAAELDASDPVEAAVLAFTGPHAFKLTVVDPDLTQQVNAVLDRMLTLHGSRPAGKSSKPRSRGRVLYDFECALQARDEARSAAILDELKAHGHLDAQNLLFQRIRRHEAFEDWPALLAILDNESILNLRRPKRVTQALLRAVYRTRLHAFEEAFQPADALDLFRDELMVSHETLLRSRQGMPAGEVAKLFMLKAAVRQDPTLRDAILGGVNLPPRDLTYLQALAALVEEPSRSEPAPVRNEARDAYLRGDPDRAFELLREGGGGPYRRRLLLRCANDLGTLEAAEVTLEELYSLPDGELDELLTAPALRRIYEELEERYTAPPAEEAEKGDRVLTAPSDWLQWLEQVQADKLDDNRAADLARQGVQEWSLAEFAARPGDMKRFAELLKATDSGPARDKRRLALPHLIAFFTVEPTPPSCKPVLMSLTEIMAYEDERSAPLLELYGQVVEALIRTGVTTSEYAGVAETHCALVLADLGAEYAGWSLELLEMLISLNPPGSESTLKIASYTQRVLLRNLHRIDPLTRRVCNALGAELGLAQPIPIEEQTATDGVAVNTLAHLLREHSVAMYSLNERALERVRRTLEDLEPGAKVLTFHGKVGSKPLESAARGADVFLIVTGAAKHAATGFIEQHRPKGKLTIRSHAKGSTSMLRELEKVAGEVLEG